MQIEQDELISCSIQISGANFTSLDFWSHWCHHVPAVSIGMRKRRIRSRRSGGCFIPCPKQAPAKCPGQGIAHVGRSGWRSPAAHPGPARRDRPGLRSCAGALRGAEVFGCSTNSDPPANPPWTRARLGLCSALSHFQQVHCGDGHTSPFCALT